MDAKLKADWTAALRSGDFKQINEFLQTARGHCCLGVLCEVSKVGQWRVRAANGYVGFLMDGDGVEASSVITDAMAKAVGLDEKTVETLWRMNDDGKPFAEIADWIDANIPAEHATDITIFKELLDVPANEYVHDDAQFGVGA
jgi:hypothetical protein